MLLRGGPDAPGWNKHLRARAQLPNCLNRTTKSCSSEWTSSGSWVTPQQRWRPRWGSWGSAQTPTLCSESWLGAGQVYHPAVLTVMTGAQAKRTFCCHSAGPLDPQWLHKQGTGRMQTQTWGLLLLMAAMLLWGNLDGLLYLYGSVDHYPNS